jgi:Nucleotidyl transferase AbiEii toxin, Type IV TA system
MQAPTFWKTVTMDKSNFLEGLISALDENRIRYCVIGGQGVNAYVEPLVSLDLDIAIAADQIEVARNLLARRFSVSEFPNRLNIAAPGSDLRVQIQTDPRYFDFVDRATRRDVLGVNLPVAAVEDILQGKIWAASDPRRRPTKRRKDLLDIERILEARPDLRPQVPDGILDRLDQP